MTKKKWTNLADIDFKELERRILGNLTPQDPALTTGRSSSGPEEQSIKKRKKDYNELR